MTWMHRLWERVLLYLPLLFMGALALGTYWLVRTTPAPDAEAGVSGSAPAGPDYFLEGFVMRAFDASGRMRTEVTGDKATHFPDAKRIAIEQVRIRSIDSAGNTTTATANTAWTDDAQTQVELRGQARVVREGRGDAKGGASERSEYRGEYLLAHFKDETVRSDQPVELTRGNGDRFTADALHYDQRGRNLRLDGRVRGTLVPRDGSSTGKNTAP
ncbi:LPS export ABC transporter periplasmic protein LptC [Curvibacter sp. APW13]|uniref:LPS export ABC transporter periplasmic protein LptC n=1 Tax=Curvibacter sp. APW13 TaxID=3077236 RepID=UPI0028E001F6|nr:LPS export ABC transporter periplasmic protein LptC [Curvibacter sp. APW13]MDT8990400.1 LPS export ABC transporter periplasmic protein LptC [Curvibacter sp. APW13]